MRPAGFLPHQIIWIPTEIGLFYVLAWEEWHSSFTTMPIPCTKCAAASAEQVLVAVAWQREVEVGTEKNFWVCLDGRLRPTQDCSYVRVLSSFPSSSSFFWNGFEVLEWIKISYLGFAGLSLKEGPAKKKNRYAKHVPLSWISYWTCGGFMLHCKQITLAAYNPPRFSFFCECEWMCGVFSPFSSRATFQLDA